MRNKVPLSHYEALIQRRLRVVIGLLALDLAKAEFEDLGCGAQIRKWAVEIHVNKPGTGRTGERGD